MNLNYNVEIILMMLLLMLMMVVIICCCFQCNLMIHIFIYITLFCELTPSAGIAALWASAGNEGL